MNATQVKSTFSLLEANKISGIGQHTLRAAVHDGSLAAIRVGHRRIRIRPEALELWLKNLEQGGAK
jgi:excisionase family DNA binding protein